MADESKHPEAALNDFSLEPVPMENRRALYATITVWGGWAISITAFLVGGLIGGGMPLSQAIPAILVGNFFLFVVASFIGTVGMKTGFSSGLIARAVFGKQGSIILSVVIGILAMGFVGVFAGSVGTFFSGGFGVPFAIGAIIFIVVVTATAIFGFRGLAVLSRIAVPLMLIMALWGIARVAADLPQGIAGIFQKSPEGSMAFGAGATLAIATWISGTIFAADVGRYAKNKWHVMAGAFTGWIVGAALLETISAMMALGVGEGDVVRVMIDIGLTVPALIIFFFAMWTTADNNLYTFSLAFTNLSAVSNITGIKKYVWVLIGAAVALFLALAGIYGQFLGFLRQIATFVPPIGGVIIGKYFLMGDFKLPMQDLQRQITDPEKNWDGVAFIAWIGGSAVAFFIKAGIPAVQGLVASMLLYAIVKKLVGNRGK